MSKLIKELLINEYKNQFEDVDEALLVDIRYLNAMQNTELRDGLRSNGVRVTVIRNRLIKPVIEGTGLNKFNPLLEGSNAVVYGEQSVVETARTVMDMAKKFKKMELKGAVLDGELFEGRKGVEQLSKFPTRDEAQAQVVQLVLSPAGSLVGAITSPGSQIVSILETIEEKLESGEEIAKV